MDLPDCPPGAEGYEDTVVEVPKKPNDPTCTKAEKEFHDHIASLKIHVDDGTTRCMVERKGRDSSGKWTYLCYPCAAVCSGEGVLQTHISGKKHKNKLGQKDPWPVSIFEQHPYILGEKGELPNNNKTEAPGSDPNTVADEVDSYNKNPSELNLKYNKYREATCHVQEILDKVKTPLLGVEYLIEHPPEEAHHEPSYVCSLCLKQGAPRTITNHMTCFWHRHNYILRHFPKACALLAPYRGQQHNREGVSMIMNRLAQRIEDKYGRLRPVNIDKEIYQKEKDQIHEWLFKSYHFSEKPGATFEEVVDIGLINSLCSDASANAQRSNNTREVTRKKDPSPPVVAAPTKPLYRGRVRGRRPSAESLSDVSVDEQAPREDRRAPPHARGLAPKRYEPYPAETTKMNARQKWSERRKNPPEERTEREIQKEMEKRQYKEKLVSEMQSKIETSAKKMLAYHEKNPEKHPLYPEEWKKFWNRRYKEIQVEGKDPSKHDFKPEWIVFWTARMKELHDEEVKVHVNELYRRMCLTPPAAGPAGGRSPRRSPRRREPERWSPARRREPPRRRTPEPRRRSPEPRRRSPEPRRRSPPPRRRTPDHRRRSPDHRAPVPDHRAPAMDYRRDLRSPPRSNPPRPTDRHHEPSRPIKSRSRSPLRPRRSPARTHITLESARSRSPLSARAAAPMRNRSPAPAPAPSLQTVLVSDDELKPYFKSSLQTVLVSDDELKPDEDAWNSDKSLESLGSLPDARSPPPASRSRSRASEVSRGSRRPAYAGRAPDPHDLGPPENIVATLRLLVALEDYLGSIGPKIVDLLTEALKMEKERANSSEELLVRDSAVVMIETAKEKLKGAVQAGLVAGGAAAAVRAAVQRAAATLHAADTRAKDKQKEETSKTAMPVAGVGEVDRAQIAQQMAAALIAQGKTDVSSEELAQLVDAVVGMAEAKKREAAEKSRAEERVVAKPKPAAATGTATALQMLQSAYDENDKRIENDAATDAMDGLSDSDLETLLKNFNELSAEEQHSLIAYLKKLEARSPQRVERLRQYVSAAAACAPAAAPAAPPPRARSPHPPPDHSLAPVTIESDDDDYTVEEVFKSATEKVKENQIRQEMEIVKKSLEETNPSPVPTPEIEAPAPTMGDNKVLPTVDLTNFSSATDLLALVQASIQSTAKVTPASSQNADVVASSSQPRSFGDRAESNSNQARESRPLLPIPTLNAQPTQQSFGNQQGGLLRTPSNFQNRSNESYNNDPWANQMPGNRPQMQENRSFMQDNRGPPMQDNRGPPMQDNRGPMQDNRGPPLQDNRGLPMQDNRGPSMQDNRGPPMQDNRGPPMQDNRGPPMQDNRGPPMQDNRGPPMQDNRGPPMQDNRGPPMQDNRGPPMQDNRGPPMQDNRGPPMQDNRGPPMQDNRGLPMQENRQPFMQGNRPFLPDNRGQNMQNRPPFMSGPPVRPQGYDNYGSDQFNQQRGNYMNGRLQDNYDTRPMDMNQQQNNYRGRGRGHYGGSRGRGRGYY